MSKHILVVSEDILLNETRVALLKTAGYTAKSVINDDDALAMLEIEHFDLILLGHQSLLLTEKGIDPRLQEKYSALLALKIGISGDNRSIGRSRITDASPGHVLKALKEMLGQ